MNANNDDPPDRCSHCIQKIIRTKRALGYTAKKTHEYLAENDIRVSYSTVITAYKRNATEEEGTTKECRSYELGDKTEEIMKIVKYYFEVVDEDGDKSEKDCMDYLEESHGVTISRAVLRNLKHAADLKCYTEIAVPEITPQQAMKRFLFVHNLIEKKENFENWIWSDESIVQIGANRRFITSSNPHDKRRFQGVRKFPRKVMIWAAITWDIIERIFVFGR